MLRKIVNLTFLFVLIVDITELLQSLWTELSIVLFNPFVISMLDSHLRIPVFSLGELLWLLSSSDVLSSSGSRSPVQLLSYCWKLKHIGCFVNSFEIYFANLTKKCVHRYRNYRKVFLFWIAGLNVHGVTCTRVLEDIANFVFLEFAL